MVKGRMKLIFAEIMMELKASGYEVSARLMNAMDFNVPQSRARMIFIGVRRDLGIMPSHPRAQSRPLTLRAAIHDHPATQDESKDHVWIDEWKIRTKWIKRVPYIKPGQKVRPKSQHVRLDWDKPCRTVTRNGGIQCYVGNSDIHASQHRTLSIREIARVSSFPDQFRFVDARKEGHNSVGDCVPPLFMAAIASHIKENVMNRRVKFDADRRVSRETAAEID